MTAGLWDTDRPMMAIETTTRTVKPATHDNDGGTLLAYATPWLRTSVANGWLAFRGLLILGASSVFVFAVARALTWIAS